MQTLWAPAIRSLACSASQRCAGCAAGAVPVPLVTSVRRRSRRAPSTTVHAGPQAPERSTDTLATVTIEDLDRNYCDDFQCVSSPAVEQVVRSLAKDLSLLRLSANLFQKDATFSDGFRSFKGKEGLTRPLWYAQAVDKPSARVVKIRMLDRTMAQIDWQISGGWVGGPGTVQVTTTATLNQLTGRVTAYQERWDLSGLSPPAAAAATVSRAWHAALAAGADVAAAVSKALAALGGDDDTPQGPYSNPSDPTRFFMGNQQNQQWNDMLWYATIAAALYAVFRAFEAVEKL